MIVNAFELDPPTRWGLQPFQGCSFGDNDNENLLNENVCVAQG